MKVWNFCRMMMERGHEVIHLGTEGSNPICTEHVSVVPEDLWQSLYGHPGTGQFNTRADGKYSILHEVYAANAKKALMERSGEDFTEVICMPWGGCQIKAVEDVPQYKVETGIGYHITFTQFRVFESYAWMHFHWGRENNHDAKRGWYDAVIPNSFDPRMFPYVDRKKRGNTFLFMGRLNEDKGVGLAVDITKRIGAKLKIVGPGPEPVQWMKEDHVEYLPPVGVDERKRLMCEARAAFVPTLYLGPFEGTAVELQMTGCPVITTDWGVFNETVLHGVTGYRCRSMDQFIWAAKNVDKLNCKDCRDWAVNNYSTERVAPMYEEYLQMVLNLHYPPGFYQENPGRDQLDYLRRHYPAGARKKIIIPKKHVPPAFDDVWEEANKWEGEWWGLERNPRWDEEEKKQVTYARLMGLPADLDIGGARVLDVGCGPTSMLLRAKNGIDCVGVDPLKISEETAATYRKANVEFKNIKAEDFVCEADAFDEAWIYNCLQHADKPRKILEMMKFGARSIRLFEWINMGTCPGHPHNLTEDLFERAFMKDHWERVIWNTGVLHDFGGTVTNNYIAIHVVKKPPMPKLTATLPSGETVKELEKAGEAVQKEIMNAVNEKLKQ
jgi:glycosyltransferase involved in cell wall biosynthesis/SAM-dependent methyltransferase